MWHKPGFSDIGELLYSVLLLKVVPGLGFLPRLALSRRPQVGLLFDLNVLVGLAQDLNRHSDAA
jgi:hypothetical protein